MTGPSSTSTPRASARLHVTGRMRVVDADEQWPGHEMMEREAPTYLLVILPAQDIRLPEVLRHIEAGKIVLVILHPR